MVVKLTHDSNPCRVLVRDCWRAYADPSAADWNTPWHPLEPDQGVTVNGLVVPVVRLPWKDVEPFFDAIYEQANQTFFQGNLSRCKRIWNRRLRKTGGRIICEHHRIELSSAHFESCGVAALAVVLVHEQIHLSLYEEGLPYGHTPEFKRRSLQIGLPSIYHEMPLPAHLAKRQQKHGYQCPACQTVYFSRVKFRAPRACKSCCDQHNRGRFSKRYVLQYLSHVQQAVSGN